MRKSTRALALLLTLLTLVGLVPFAVFADEASVASEENTKTSGESLKETLDAEGRTMLSANDFESGKVTILATQTNDVYTADQEYDLVDGLQMPDFYHNWLTNEYYQMDTEEDGTRVVETLTLSDGTTVVNKVNTGGSQWRLFNSSLSSGQLLFHNKRSMAEIVSDETGNSYLEVTYPEHSAKDAYADMLSNGHVAGSDFVVSGKFMKQENSKLTNGGKLALLTVSFRNLQSGMQATLEGGTVIKADRLNTGGMIAIVNYDDQGRIFAAKGGKQVGQLTSVEFTTVSVGIRLQENKADIYVNGYLMETTDIFTEAQLTKFTKSGTTYTADTPYDLSTLSIKNGENITRTSFGANNTKSMYGGLCLDDMFAYSGSVPVEAKYEGEGENRAPVAPLSGWVQTEENYWRYYENGVPALFNKTIAGVDYYFEREGAYAARAERDHLVELERVYTQKTTSGGTVTGDNLVSQIANHCLLSPNTTMRGKSSSRYTYIWADMFKASYVTTENEATLKTISNGSVSPVFYVGVGAGTGGTKRDYFRSSLIVKKADLTGFAGTEPLNSTDTYINLKGYEAIEIVAFQKLESNFAFYMVMGGENWNRSNLDQRFFEGYESPTGAKQTWNVDDKSGRGGGTGPLAAFYPKAANNGWNSYMMFLGGGAQAAKAVDNQLIVGAGQNREAPNYYVKNLNISPFWSGIASKYENLDKFEFYVDAIYAVRYEPIQSEYAPGAGFVTLDNGNVRYYENAYDYATGWTTIGEDEYYFYPYNGYMATGMSVIPVTAVDGKITVIKAGSGATATGTATEVDHYSTTFVGMQFSENGVLIDDTATGWFKGTATTGETFDCIYVDGVLQNGTFEYDNNGNGDIDSDEKYYAASNGEIYSNIGEIGYTYENTYVRKEYSSEKQYLLAQDFESYDEGYFFGTRFGNRAVNSAQLDYITGLGTSINSGKAYVSCVAKLSKFTVVAEADGNKSLQMTNDSCVDSYFNMHVGAGVTNDGTGYYAPQYAVKAPGEATHTMVNAYETNGDSKDLLPIVLEFDAKIDPDWNVDNSSFFFFIGVNLTNGKRENVGSQILHINKQGYIYPSNDSSKLLCKVSDDVWTNFAFVADQKNGTCDVYINGVLVIEDYAYIKSALVNKWVITEARAFQYGATKSGSAYIDNLYVFMGDTPTYDAGKTATKSGWLYEGGVWRYYVDGAMTTSSSAELPVRGDDGSSSETETASYYFNPKNGMCIGTAEGWINGQYFIEGKIQANMWTTDSTGREGEGLRYVGANGYTVTGYQTIDGTLYYFNTSTGVLEIGGSLQSETLLSVKEMVASGQCTAYNLGGRDSAFAVKMRTNAQGKWQPLLATLDTPADITDAYKQANKVMAVDVYVAGTYDATWTINLENDRTFHEIEFDTASGVFKMVEGGKVLTEEEHKALKPTEYGSNNVSGLKTLLASLYGVDAAELADGIHTLNGIIPGVNKSQALRVNVSGNETDGYKFYGRRYSYHMGATQNLKNLQAGWNTVYIPMKNFGDNGAFDPTAVTMIQFVVSGWSFACNATNMDVKIGDIRIYTLDEVSETVQNGMVGNKYYDNSVIPVIGWYDYLDGTRYADVTGNYVTGLKFIEGVLYEFDADGYLIGAVNGKYTVPGITGVGDSTAEVQMEKVFVNGVLQTGFYDGDVDYVLSETTGEITKDTNVKVEINGTPYIYACGADGAASKAGQGVHEVGDAKYYVDSKGVVQVGTAAYYAKDKLFLNCEADGKLTVNGFGEYTNAYHGEDGNAYALSIYGVNVAVSSDVTYNVYVNYPAGLAAAQLKVMIPRVFADLKITFNFCDRTETVSIADAAAANQTVTINGQTYLKVSFEGISAKKLGDDVTVTVTNGEKVMPAECTNSGSVADYLYALLGTTAEVADAEMKALAVQLLNYGAAAQTYFGYNTEALVNAELTEEQKAYAAGLTLPEFNETDHKEVAVSNNGLTVDDGRIDPAMFALSLDNKVNLIVGFNKEAVESFYGENPELYVYFGTATEGVRLEAGEDDLAGYYVAKAPVDIKTLTARVSITVKDSEGTVVSGTFEYGVCSYALFVANDGETDDLDALMEALLLYGEAADAYAEAALTGGLNTENNPVNDPFEDDVKWNS